MVVFYKENRPAKTEWVDSRVNQAIFLFNFHVQNSIFNRLIMIFVDLRLWTHLDSLYGCIFRQTALLSQQNFLYLHNILVYRIKFCFKNSFEFLYSHITLHYDLNSSNFYHLSYELAKFIQNCHYWHFCPCLKWVY